MPRNPTSEAAAAEESAAMTGNYFPSSASQRHRAIEWAERDGYRWSPRQLAHARDQIGDLPTPSLAELCIPVLMPWRESVKATLAQFWRTIRQSVPRAYNWFSSEHCPNAFDGLDEVFPTEPRNELEWVIIELNRNAGVPLGDLAPESLAGVELLALAAYAPEWAAQLGYEFPQVVAGSTIWTPYGSWGPMHPWLSSFPSPGRLFLNGIKPGEADSPAKPEVTRPFSRS